MNETLINMPILNGFRGVARGKGAMPPPNRRLSRFFTAKNMALLGHRACFVQ